MGHLKGAGISDVTNLWRSEMLSGKERIANEILRGKHKVAKAGWRKAILSTGIIEFSVFSKGIS